MTEWGTEMYEMPPGPVQDKGCLVDFADLAIVRQEQSAAPSGPQEQLIVASPDRIGPHVGASFVPETIGETDDSAPIPEEPACQGTEKGMTAREHPGDEEAEAITSSPPEHTGPSEEVAAPPISDGPAKPPIDPPADPGEAAADGEEPLMPSTLADVKWEALRNGTVEVLEGSSAEVVKIYHFNNGGESKIVRTADGTPISIGDDDIVQVFSRDADGVIAARPTEIFQGRWDLPEGYEVDLPLPDQKNEPETQEFFDALLEGPDPLPAFGRANPRTRFLNLLSETIRGFTPGRSIGEFEIFSGNEHEVLITYPLFGTPTAVIIPNGMLLKGRSHDIIEIAHLGPDGGYQTLRRHRFGNLARAEEGYIDLQE